jgi:hypothetical protein
MGVMRNEAEQPLTSLRALPRLAHPAVSKGLTEKEVTGGKTPGWGTRMEVQSLEGQVFCWSPGSLHLNLGIIIRNNGPRKL